MKQIYRVRVNLTRSINPLVLDGINKAIIHCYPHLLICGNDDGTISIWDLERRMWLDRFQAHQKEINSIAFIDRLNRVISCSVDGAIKVWKLQNYSLVEVHSIESIKPYQLMQLGNNQGLNRAHLTALVQLGASI
ncbi:MAG: hypothetical protein HC778_05590 [Chamaesiphon sp. CSU_1_12]|nr:hypothetical protein [Chamaesiphon sp. CSU_1_12]